MNSVEVNYTFKTFFCRFDLIFDNVGGDYHDLTINLLRSWRNSKYVTVVSPMLKNADEKGVIFGTVLSAVQAGLDTAMVMSTLSVHSASTILLPVFIWANKMF